MAVSTGLNITKYVDGQNNPDTTINLILDILDALARVLVHDMASDADYTLATTGTEPFEWQYGAINITDTVVGISARNIIVPTFQRQYLFHNNTAVILTLKTAAGTGIGVAAGASAYLYCDGTNVLRSSANF